MWRWALTVSEVVGEVMGATSRIPLITTSQLQEITATLSEGCGSGLPTPTRGLNCMWPVHGGSMNGGAGLFRGALLVHLNSTIVNFRQQDTTHRGDLGGS